MSLAEIVCGVVIALASFAMSIIRILAIGFLPVLLIIAFLYLTRRIFIRMGGTPFIIDPDQPFSTAIVRRPRPSGHPHETDSDIFGRRAEID